ncbi:acyl-CoA dehydrogenase family protein [Erythrobacter alti]|uniref:acyl-CoA dehydrogenase family protein n=1 Tax=Erythrobacter alti TaxID=1896145 RepID=UPI0030F41C45
MDFAFTDEQRMIDETVKGFFSEIATSEKTRTAMAADGFDRALWTAFCEELGLGGVNLPEEHGGAGLGMVEFAILAEAAGAQVAAIPLLGLAMASDAILKGGSDDQKQDWLAALAGGEAIGACTFDADVSVSGDQLSGTTGLVAHAGVADLLIVGTESEGWLVRTDDPGVTITVHTTMDQTRPLATVTLDSAKAQSLSNWNAARDAALAAGWICLAAEALGGAQATLDRTVAYAKEREQFGRPIGSFQAYKHRLADMMIEIEQARSAVYWAACAMDEGSDDAALALNSAKAFCADTFFKCAGDMIQLHGGIGFTWEHDAHLFFKRARSIQTLLGSGNWHREQVAKTILGEAA